LEMIEEIRIHHDHMHPIVVTTGYDDDEHKSEEADAHLYKPINIVELLEVVHTQALKYGKIKE